MVKQAALEMWQGFWRNIRSWRSLAVIAFLAVFTAIYEQGDFIMYMCYFPILLGQAMGFLFGGRTGKLTMILPISPRDRKKLIFTKALLLGILELLYFGTLHLVCSRELYQGLLDIVLLVLPAVMFSTQMFMQSMLPAKNMFGEGYRFSLWPCVGGVISVMILSLGYRWMPIYISILLSVAFYVFISFNYWKIGNTIEYQMIYYDVVEKEAERVRW